MFRIFSRLSVALTHLCSPRSFVSPRDKVNTLAAKYLRGKAWQSFSTFGKMKSRIACLRWTDGTLRGGLVRPLYSVQWLEIVPVWFILPLALGCLVGALSTCVRHGLRNWGARLPGVTRPCMGLFGQARRSRQCAPGWSSRSRTADAYIKIYGLRHFRIPSSAIGYWRSARGAARSASDSHSFSKNKNSSCLSFVP